LTFLASLSAMAQEKLDTTAMPEEKRIAYRKIEGYRQLVLKGEKMSNLAALYSQDPGSASNGGAYYNIGKGVFVPEFEKAAWALKPGDVSEVFETQYGFHFVQLIDKHGDLMDVRHILIKTN
jgi:peptidyl-prolyl cis-trans isomerase SurA